MSASVQNSNKLGTTTATDIIAQMDDSTSEISFGGSAGESAIQNIIMLIDDTVDVTDSASVNGSAATSASDSVDTPDTAPEFDAPRGQWTIPYDPANDTHVVHPNKGVNLFDLWDLGTPSTGSSGGGGGGTGPWQIPFDAANSTHVTRPIISVGTFTLQI